jgi:hypothetical protein
MDDWIYWSLLYNHCLGLAPFWLAPFWSLYSDLNYDWLHSESESESESEFYVTTDGQSASVSWNKAPIWCLRPDFYYCQTVAGLLMWGAFSGEGTGLSFTTAAGTRQRSHSWVRVPWDSRPYFTVSDLRLPFSLPPTTRRVTVEVPASTRDWLHSDLNGLLCSVSVSKEMFVVHSYPRKRLLISQRRVGSQESISTETCLSLVPLQWIYMSQYRKKI